MLARLSIDRSSRNYLVLSVDFVADNGDFIRRYDDNDAEYRNIEIRAQADSDRDRVGFYGYDVKWRTNYSGIDASEAKEAYKTLAKIDKGLVKWCEKWGYSPSYDEYIMRICDVVGCEGYFNGYAKPLSDLREDILRLLREFKAE
jgi:hypothetical protein